MRILYKTFSQKGKEFKLTPEALFANVFVNGLLDHILQ